ncbi:MAG: hypothetical protein IPL46_00760 [Saprospiraceae bacterium]|nr:hypothetical protein [Saprospiraceae bacterium]
MSTIDQLFCTIVFFILWGSCNPLEEQILIGSDAIMNPNGRNDNWGFVGPGGGGAMPYIPSINPSDPNNVFVSCDMTGSFVTYDGGEKWRMFNLRGVVQFYAFDRKNANVVYAGTSDMLFKSVDKGVSWQTIYPIPSDIVAIHSQGDHAEEFVVTNDSIVTIVKKLAVDPDDPKRLFLLVRQEKIDSWPRSKDRHSRFHMQIMVSEDGGDHWETLEKLRFDLDHIFLDPTSSLDNRTIYVAGKDGLGVRKKGTWSHLIMPDGARPILQFVDGMDTVKNQHVIYAMSGKFPFGSEDKRNNSAIFRTDNGGKSWERVDMKLLDKKIDGANDPTFASIATSYYHPENIYISYSKLQFHRDSMSFGVAKSSDSGNHWTLSWQDRSSILNTGGSVIASSNRESAWIDQRFGPSWGENPFYVQMSDHSPEIAYTTDWGRVFKTSDGGDTWQQVYTRQLSGGFWQSRGIQVTSGYMLAPDPFDSMVLFMADTDIGLMKSIDGGESWTSTTKDNGIPKGWDHNTYGVLFDQRVKGKMWAAMSPIHDIPRPKMWRNRDMSEYTGGIVMSENGGTTWIPVSQDIGEAAVTSILMDPDSEVNSRTLYVCGFGRGVFKSVDDGHSWVEKNQGIEGSQPATFQITLRADDELFLIVSRKSEDGSIGTDLDGALYRSSDHAETWVKQQLPEGVNGPTSLLVDPDNPNRLFLSAWGRYGDTEFSPNQGGGIYLSEDDGNHWTPILTHDQHIYELTVDPRNGIFYAAGFNASAYRSEDNGLTWGRIKGYNFKWGKTVIPDRVDSEKIYIITFGGGVWYGPAKGDENAMEDIATPQTAY